MNPILKALGLGYGANQILRYLSQNNPQLSSQISTALNSGYTVDQIIKYMSKHKKTVENFIPDEQSPSSNLYKTAQTSIHPALKGMAQAGMMAASAFALSRALPMAAQALNPAAPGPSPLPTTPQLGAPTPPNVTPPPIPPTPAPAQPTPQAAPVQPMVNIPNLINKHGLARHIEELRKSYPDPQHMAAILFQKFPMEMKALQQESGKPMEEAIKDYLNASLPLENDQEMMKKPLESSQVLEKEPLKKPIIEHVEEPKEIVKGSEVVTPSGMGKVKEIRKKEAIIDTDGKLSKVKVEDLQMPSFSDDEVADAYDKLMSIIPEEHKSGFISWAGYDENRNVVGYIPRGGGYHEVEDITPEEAQRIKEGKGVARTSGETREGLWVLGEDTRGGIISQIVHDRAKIKKSQEEQQLKFNLDLPEKEKQQIGMNPIFDEMAYARNLSRERDRKKKLEARERKKREKDEAKKRKKQT